MSIVYVVCACWDVPYVCRGSITFRPHHIPTTQQQYGRRGTFLVTALLTIVGNILQATAQVWENK